LAATTTVRDDRYVLNFCAKHLARDAGAPSESWRFPIVDRHREPDAPGRSWSHDSVTFVWDGRHAPPQTVELTGAMGAMLQPVPLQPVRFEGEATGFWSVSMLVPRNSVHRYLFLVDEQLLPDPINPQRVRSDNGTMWSRFFTSGCVQPLVLERWEFTVLQRLTDHILPFRTREGEQFLARYYYSLDSHSRDQALPLAYRIDQSVGVANYIDCILAREESHRLVDYRLCLREIARVLKNRFPTRALADVPREAFAALYGELARNDVPGWDYSQYDEPRFFLKLLRRHAVTGAFSHPDYGGNTGGAGWAFLRERYLDTQPRTLFDFGQALEPGLGHNPAYRG
jgi:hypothetical protein